MANCAPTTNGAVKIETVKKDTADLILFFIFAPPVYFYF
jgi:hypothetical protein